MFPTVTTKLSTFKFGEAEKGGKEYKESRNIKRGRKKKTYKTEQLCFKDN